MQEGYVKTELNSGIAVIEFFHPQSNSLPGNILNELAGQVRAAGENRDAKLIILRSGGDRAFCAGASFDELIAVKNETEGLNFFSGFANVINAMRLCPKFIIGRIQGRCVGGGVGLAAACDQAIATGQASVKLSELAMGIGPFVIGPAVQRKIGISVFSQMAIHSSTWFDAGWAKEKGLFNDVFDTIEQVDKAITELATSLADSSPEAMAEMKKIFWQGTENWDQLLKERAAISGRLVLSEFTRKSIAAFKNPKKI
jgi:methylglutaconyl-CoA hydratase